MDELTLSREKFINDVVENYPKNKDKILSALDFATKSHEGVVRKSGEPYIIHPIAVAQILVDNQMDYSTVIAGLLHDVVEDTNITLDEIEQRFGKTVAKLVDGVTKIDSITVKENNLTEDDSRKRLLLAMGDDIRVIFIKLADRLHNMRTISFLSPERQFAISKETQELFIPIAELLGVRNLRSELQSLAFKCLFFDSYQNIKKEQDGQLKNKAKKILSIERKLNEIFDKKGIDAKISWWPERYYSIYKKMRQQGFNKTFSLVLFKIIVPTVDDCYRALGMVHQVYKPIPSQIKDYIASPKINGYQSLQSVVMNEDSSIIFNVMIRTPEMNKVCEYGILALASRKDAKEDFNSKFEKYNKLKAIISGERSEGAVASTSFVSAIKTDLSSKATWVFTSKIKPTKIESSAPTAIDFAYVLGDDVGNNATGAIINGKVSSLGSVLKSGDVVEIVGSKENKAPCRAWLNIAKTHLARTKIREFFVKNMSNDSIEKGKLEIKQEFNEKGYDLRELDSIYQKIKFDYSFVSVEDMFSTVGLGGLKASQISALVSTDKLKNNALKMSPVEVLGESFAFSVVLSKCCCPIFGDEIVAVKSKNGLSVHTKNCLNLSRFDKSKILPARWKENVDQIFEVNLKIVAKDNIGFGSKMLGAISALGVDISKIFAKQRNGECEFKLTLKLNNIKQLNEVIKKLTVVEGVKTIVRTFD